MNQGKLYMVKYEIKSEYQHFRNQWTKIDNNWVNLIQMAIVSNTVGKNPLEEME